MKTKFVIHQLYNNEDQVSLFHVYVLKMKPIFNVEDHLQAKLKPNLVLTRIFHICLSSFLLLLTLIILNSIKFQNIFINYLKLSKKILEYINCITMTRAGQINRTR